jgi:hypothetical protein
MKYDSDNFTMSFLYGIAGLLSASHLLAHLLVDKTKKHLGLCSPNQAVRVAHCLIWPSSSAFLTRGNPFQIILVTRSTSAFHRCRVYLSFKFHLITRNEIQYETNWGYSNALWSSPLLRQRQSATYVKLLARSVHTEQLPSTTPVRPICLSSHIKDMY